MAITEVRDSVLVSVRGVVQGVGFRPFVYQLATKYHLNGRVYNTSEDLKIEVEGDVKAIQHFLNDLREKAPPRASIETITITHQTPSNFEKFEIRESRAEQGKYQLVSPDIATCPECLKEIFSPDNRRYRYPFTNCTNCGPRFTIIEDIPYDRPLTTMRNFRMCPQCQKEYDDPLNRRFHAQPNACPVCGPKLEILDASGCTVSVSDPLTKACRLLLEGKIIALKGLGGFLLACDATSDSAVNLLRERKKRPFKPLAIMVPSLEEAGRYCYVYKEEANLLASPQAPILLLKYKTGSSLSGLVAPNLKYLGVMLPYTPLHHLLLRETGRPLVMTSGNLSEEPIVKDNGEAVKRLAHIADYFLVHNRDIYARYDDSVTMVERGVPQVVRRARGYAPYPVHLNFESKQILGCGAELKNTFCLARDNYAFLSQHIGEMENLETLEHFRTTIDLYEKLFRIRPEIIAHDMHPDYLATGYARELFEKSNNLELVPVQHHHAHIVSGMADNGLDSPVIGIALDGTGFGTDGTIWGGEFLVADFKDFTRMGHLEYLPLAGGDLAIKKPYRTAIGYLLSLLGESTLQQNLSVLKDIDHGEIEIIQKQVSRKINSPLTSSCGRLFDAVSALIGVRGEAKYEAQAAIELEMLAYDEENDTIQYPFSIVEKDGGSLIKLAGLFSSIISDLNRNESKATISVRFHNTIASMVTEMSLKISEKTGIKQVVLTGGVFQNRLLLKKTVDLLEAGGFQVFTHKQVPANDGGISLGQVVIANFADRS